jgi:hypothetical protein
MFRVSCPGVEQERSGIIRHGAKMLSAYGSCTAPKITVILRKAYGGSYLAMCSQEMGADMVFAWPTAEIAVMGAEAAVKILYRKELGGGRGSPGKGRRTGAGIPRRVRVTLRVGQQFLHHRRDRTTGYALDGRPGAAQNPRQARTQAGEEARQHPHVIGNGRKTPHGD